MLIRVIVSSILIPIVIVSIQYTYLNYISIYILFFAISFLSAFEINNIIKKILNGSYFKGYILGLYILNAAAFLLHYSTGSRGFIFIFIAFLSYAIVSTIFKRVILRESLYFLLAFVYTGVIPLLIPLIRTRSYGNYLVYLLLFLTWTNDAAALFIGKKFGKIKRIVKYSPNKSLEGYIGSFFVTIILGILFKIVFSKKICFSTGEMVLISILISIFGHIGDIFESYLKRKAGLKDSSAILPGLGGILDVFDSVFASLPFFYMFILMFC